MNFPYFRAFSIVAVSVLALAVPASSSIITTEVTAGMRIDVDGVTDAIATDSDAVLASVDIFSPLTEATASSRLHFDSLTAEQANLDFSIAYEGNGFIGYLGQSSDDANHAVINYHANVPSTLEYGWNFDYLGPNPFGLQVVRIYRDGVVLETLGEVGFNPGHHEGTGSIGLVGGFDYAVEVLFIPNVFGGINDISGELAGDVFFNFNGTSVPEPGAITLFGLGLFALSMARRRGAH